MLQQNEKSTHKSQIFTLIDVTPVKQYSEVNLDPLPEDIEMHQGLLAELMKGVFIVGSLVILQTNGLRRTSVDQVQHLEEGASKHKGCSHLYKGGQEEDDEGEKEVMAAMCRWVDLQCHTTQQGR